MFYAHLDTNDVSFSNLNMQAGITHEKSVHTTGILQMILHCWQMYLDLFLSNSEIIKASTSSPRKFTAFGNGRSLNSNGFLVSAASTCLSSSCVDVNSSASSSPENNTNKKFNSTLHVYF